jgi:hypothetical protein
MCENLAALGLPVVPLQSVVRQEEEKKYKKTKS